MILPVLLFSACRVGKNYNRPEQALPASYRYGSSTDTGNIALISYDRFFTDPELQGLIRTALDSNFDLRLAVSRIDMAEQYLKQARLSFLPSLVGQVAASTNNPSDNSLNGLSLKNFIGTNHIEDFTAGLLLSWELDIWGKIRRQKEAAAAGYLQSREAARAVQTSLVAGIADRYYNLLMLDAQLEIARANLALSDTIVYMMRLQKDAGVVTELAVQQALSQQQAAALIVPRLQQLVAVQEHAISLLIGSAPAEVRRTGRLDNSSLLITAATGVPASLLANRPDVRAAEMEIVVANARAGAAQAEMYPALSITAAGGVNAFKASNWFNIPASLFGTVAGNLAQPVFQHRRLKTQWEVARLEREQAVIRFRQTTLNAVREVSDALAGLEYLETQNRIASEQVVTLKQAVGNAQLLFRSGMANYLEVISVQESRLRAELDQVQLKGQQLSAGIELYRALGGGM